MWSRNGTELFYVPAPGQFRVVAVGTGPAFGFTPPVSIPRPFGLAPPSSPRPFDILPDGRFVGVDAVNPVGDQRGVQIHVVLNWFSELNAKLPSTR